MNAVNREPAIRRRATHPADSIPDRPAAAPVPAPEPTPSAAQAPALPPLAQPAPAPQSVPTEERLIEQHNVRIRPSTKARLQRAVDKLRYETGDRSISIASLTDQALREFLDRKGA